ncbi:MAG TPA: hypothetical protein VN602_11080 [Gemmatimonadaceae bacterium]|nr:hypothetical protein [Gemmatimonadaceae bacterium]
MTKVRVYALAIAAAAASSGCGYRIVHNPDLVAKRVAMDSSTIVALQQQLSSLRVQCLADSVRLEGELGAARAAAAATVVPPPPPVSDSVSKARAAEITSLKDQLAKVSAELDRIKRRLANPRP